ncbi:dioxygenase family protein [Nocardioides bruguierae]|uniref:Dioxygenase n=1 Tax=Nocardioides bruguierae TaxID=2945102 RepID=A0A9X2D616_9ACTN|nr:class III extradiol ring-cleavage dioxygenase [Nocardioides bruguierae]MCM0619831.1 dioxygenase [Nocardioides bruguierae]
MTSQTIDPQTAPERRMPALFIGHGAPPLLDDPVWSAQLKAWARDLPRPKAILIVSAHWESAPLTLSASNVPLIYDFGGFDPKYFREQYATPDASVLAYQVAAMMADNETVHQHRSRGLDHGAWVPLKLMYPEADIPVLQMSLPTHDPERLLKIGERLRPLRDEGVLIVGSGFLTHGLPFLRDFRIEAKAPGWSKEFDSWAGEAMAQGDVDELARFKDVAPGMPYAHPTVEHYSPLFVTLGAASDAGTPGEQVIGSTGEFWMGLSKRSLQVA